MGLMSECVCSWCVFVKGRCERDKGGSIYIYIVFIYMVLLPIFTKIILKEKIL